MKMDVPRHSDVESCHRAEQVTTDDDVDDDDDDEG